MLACLVLKAFEVKVMLITRNEDELNKLSIHILLKMNKSKKQTFGFYKQVVRAASPVLLRFIVLGAFFIYCTVS